MKQSTKVLLFGIVYAIIANLLNDDAPTIGLIYASLSALTTILFLLLDMEEERVRRIYYV